MNALKNNKGGLAAATLGPSTAGVALGLAMHATHGDAATVLLGMGAVGGGALGLAALTRSWGKVLAGAGAGAGLLLGQAAITGALGPADSFYAWAFNAIVGGTWYGVVKYRDRYDSHHLDKQIKLNRYQQGLVRLEMTQHQLANRVSPASEPAPVLVGRTVEETAIREALHMLWKTQPLGASVLRTAYGWAATLDLPATLPRDKVIKNWGMVADHLALPGKFEAIPGEIGGRVIAHHFARDLLADLIPYAPAPSRTFLDPIPLGLDKYGNPVQINLAYFHTLIAGSSNYGKSNLVKLVALRLAEAGAELYGIDMKPGAPELNLIRPILRGLATTVEQARALFDWLDQEMQERGEILAEAGDTKWIPEKHGRPAIFVLADELAELVRQGDDKDKNPGEEKISKQLESLLALARAYAIHLVLITQQPSKAVFGGKTDGRGNVTNRLCARMNERIHNQFVFADPAWDTSTLDLPGKFLMQSPDHLRPVEYKAQFVSDTVCAGEVARLSPQTATGPQSRRMILPAPLELNNQDRVREALSRCGPMTRKELELATMLDEKQVLRACSALGSEVLRDPQTGVWSLQTAWEYSVAGENAVGGIS
ncbi:FtsK/SpoIIIE domain-containing protein [Sphaerisporangium sp. NPDC049002]|uniref:FtsK/SpoIIIE domain-containing protein n=1 Tax=Sphaerisporangium sp. NPDC049002 TaxID=3155392 RepID=UPI0033C6C1A5